MDRRIHGVLDGEIPPDELTPAEAEAAGRAAATLRSVIAGLDRPLPDLAPPVLRRLDELHGPTPAAAPTVTNPLRRMLQWIWRSRTVSIGWRPVYGFAGALVLAVLLFGVRQTARPPVQSDRVLTTFVLHAPEARAVSLAGDFTDWKPSFAMTRAEPGFWTVVVPLQPGIHNYAFVVDDERWVADPNAPAFDDGFGGVNSRLAVLTPDAKEL